MSLVSRKLGKGYFSHDLEIKTNVCNALNKNDSENPLSESYQ